MLTESLYSAVAGVFFGAALTVSRVHLPAVIVNQFRLTDFHMFHVFTVAMGSSAIIMLALERLHIINRPVRSNSSLGWFSAYDGNIIGGMMVGVGMALSGACPGTVLVQYAQDINSAKATAVGAVLGGGAYVRFLQIKPQRWQQVGPAVTPSKRTISEASQIPEAVLYGLLGASILGFLGFTTAKTQSTTIVPTAGGLLIGLAQAVSLLLTAAPLGVSTAYEQGSRYLLRALGNATVGKPIWPPKSIIFALGVIVGSTLLSSQSSFGGDLTGVSLNISRWRACAGGFIMTFGARLGGGCTSGHGLSGLSAMSYSSLLTVSSMFGAGILTQCIISTFAAH